MFSSVISFLDFFGVAVFAISGALTAGHKKLDIFGVMVVALITCLGGGTLRDLILNSHPVIWVENTNYLLVGILSAFSTFLVVRLYKMPMRLLEVCDAIGLAFFTIAGMQKAQLLGYSPE
ncbi:MAG: putative membrane protein YeiH, partial [Oleiphilaceae bacterium]